MSDDRWLRVKALFEAAVERPPEERAAFVSAAAQGDEGLRREVESLLVWDSQDGDVLDRLPLATAVLVNEPATGERLGPYQVIGLLGSGAMGEVYRARDTSLHREVALKVVPQLLAGDDARLARFRREAQLLAALNHPNIAAIYGLEETTNVPALVLELVEGPTLADLIARGPMDLDDLLPLAKQIAEALEAAHERGVIHRDLKPANIKVRPDGVVKVLDFGLAKALDPATVRPESEPALTKVAAATHDGVILGTAAYMAPEQARGLAVDRRADIWAFGCVLFEMVSGRQAFRGDTVTDLLAAVVKNDPEWHALPAATPSAVRALLARCLKKDPRQRLQAIGDARIEIESILEGTPPSAVPASAARTRAVTMWVPWVALALLTAAVALRELRRPAGPDNPLSNARFSRVTDWDGSEAGAAISPDGRFVAFAADRDGRFDIWLTQIGTGRFQNLTGGLRALQPGFRIFRRLGFSGDGADIWFGFETGPSMAQMTMPIMGGTPRPFLDKAATAPAWSPDGAHVVYFKNEDGDPLFVADPAGLDARRILVQPGEHIHNPAWAPDSQWIYFARGREPSDSMDVWRVRPTGESPQRLTEHGIELNFVAPLDARTVLYTSRAEDRSGPWLWSLDVEHRVSERVSTGIGHYTSVSASRDGRRVVATVANPTATLWRVPIPTNREAVDQDVHPFKVPTSRALAPRFAGTSLFYLSASGTGDGLWRLLDGEASEVSKGGVGGLFEPAAVSRDGSQIAIVVTRDGKRQLLVVSADGRTSRTLASSLTIQGAVGQALADWSPDGSSIVIGASDTGGPGLFKVSVADGAVVRLVTGQAANPIWSPDGQFIIYGGKFFTGQVELLAVRPDGTPLAIRPLRTRPGGYRFLRGGSALVYLPFIPSQDFWVFDFADGTQRQITRLSNLGSITTFDVTPDSRAIVFDRSRENADVVLIDLSKQ